MALSNDFRKTVDNHNFGGKSMKSFCKSTSFQKCTDYKVKRIVRR